MFIVIGVSSRIFSVIDYSLLGKVSTFCVVLLYFWHFLSHPYAYFALRVECLTVFTEHYFIIVSLPHICMQKQYMGHNARKCPFKNCFDI